MAVLKGLRDRIMMCFMHHFLVNATFYHAYWIIDELRIKVPEIRVGSIFSAKDSRNLLAHSSLSRKRRKQTWAEAWPTVVNYSNKASLAFLNGKYHLGQMRWSQFCEHSSNDKLVRQILTKQQKLPG